MSCYLRFDEVLIGVTVPQQEINWDAVFMGWPHEPPWFSSGGN